MSLHQARPPIPKPANRASKAIGAGSAEPGKNVQNNFIVSGLCGPDSTSISRVVVIESKPGKSRQIAAGFGGAGGFSVTETASAREGLEAALFTGANLVVLDAELADGNSADLLAQIRSSSEIPVIVISKKANAGEVVQFLAAGADDCLVEPFGINVLLARAQAVLRRHLWARRISS
jgi:DNA-binding response OmpR family regulator